MGIEKGPFDDLMSPEQIYDNFQQGQGSQNLAAASQVLSTLVQSYNERAGSLQGLADTMEALWHGDASDAARHGAMPMVRHHAQVAQPMATAGDLLSRQAGSFDTAKASVVPVPPVPKAPDPWANLSSDGGLNRTFEQQVRDYFSAAHHNVDVMSAYEGASNYNADNLPRDYGTLAADDATFAVGAETPTGASTGGGRTEHRSPVAGDPAASSTGGLAPGGAAPTRGAQWPPPHGGTTGSSGTPMGHPAPGSGPVPGGATPGGGGSVAGTGGDQGGWPGDGAAEPVPGSSRTGGGRPEPGGAGGAPGARSGRAGGGAVQPGPGGRFRSGVGAPVPGGRPGSGAVEPTPGAGRAAIAAEEAVARRGGGVLGGMPVGAGGRGVDDDERARPSYLVEPDPDEVFDSDTVTAPPVIGID